jgi:O-antigen ligase/tetratricopeptide (TPR) repeat protein
MRHPGRLLLAAGLIFLVLLGGTEAGRLATGLRAMGALVGGVAILVYLWQMPRENDLVDRLVLAGLVAFLVTCLTSAWLRQSFDAATSAIAYAAAFYMARGAVADERGRQLAITALGMMGIVIGLTFLTIWGSVWLRWIMVPGAGFPPFDLALPGYLYGHQYPVGMLAAMLLPATLLLARRPGIWPLAVIGSGATLLVAFMSGGRAIWLAGLGGLLVGVLVARGVRLPSVGLRFRLVALSVAGLAIIAVLAVSQPLLHRLAATSTIDLRLAMWQTAISHWLASPLLGFGPGSFASEFSLTGYYSTYRPNVPHAHNVMVQVLFEGGILGYLALGLVCSGVVVAIARTRRWHWSSAAAISFFILSSATDNPTVVPFLLGPLIVWASLACPRARVSRTEPRTWVSAMTLSAAVVVGMATLATVGASWEYDRASEAATAGDRAQVLSSLAAATRMDPSFALYHRELGVWLQSVGDLPAALAELTTAMELNPSDAVAFRAAALLYAQEGNRDEAVRLASTKVALEGAHIENTLTLAFIHAQFGDTEGERSALVAAVRRAPWLTAAPEWTLAFPNALPGPILLDAFESWQGDSRISARNLRARAWLAGLTGAETPAGASPAIQVHAAVLACRIQEAEQTLASLSLDAPAATQGDGLQAQLLFKAAYGDGRLSEITTLIKLRDPGLGETIARAAGGTSPIWSAFYDNRYYDRLPIQAPTDFALPTATSGLSAWLRDPVNAADRGAPDSGLANCR